MSERIHREYTPTVNAFRGYRLDFLTVSFWHILVKPVRLIMDIL